VLSSPPVVLKASTLEDLRAAIAARERRVADRTASEPARRRLLFLRERIAGIPQAGPRRRAPARQHWLRPDGPRLE
jgi:hypothetical protein